MTSPHCDSAMAKEPAPPLHHNSRPFEDDAEALILIFLSTLPATTTATATSALYRPSQLLTIAQTFFALLIAYLGGAKAPSDSAPFSVCTERDLYYRSPSLFGHQRMAHASVERLCCWLDVARVWATLRHRGVDTNPALVKRVFCMPQFVYAQLHRALESGSASDVAESGPRYTRESLGITAAGRSSVAGAITMEFCRPPEVVDLRCCGTASMSLTYSLVARLVTCYRPASSSSLSSSFSVGAPSALVFIEKESVFHAVLQAVDRRQGALSRSFIFLCTKGYPCVAAQEWLRRVHAAWPSLELHALVDGDPHGLCIALTAMGLLGSCARRAADPVAAILPFHFAGTCPSRVFERGSTNYTDRSSAVHSSTRAPHATIPTTEGIPLSRDDRQVLRRVSATLQRALNDQTAASHAAGAADEQAIVRCTLQKMVREVEWMERSGAKCELQLACRGYEDPLHFIEANLLK